MNVGREMHMARRKVDDGNDCGIGIKDKAFTVVLSLSCTTYGFGSFLLCDATRGTSC